MVNKVVKLIEPALAGAILTAQLVIDGVTVGFPVGIDEEVNGEFTFIFDTVVTARWYRIDIYEGSNLAYWGWVYFPGDIAGSYVIVSDKTAVEAVSSIELPGGDAGVE